MVQSHQLSFLLYSGARSGKNTEMNGGWLLTGVGLIIAALAGGTWLSRDARLRRRRRKSHSRIISKSDKPNVRFSVQPPDEK